MPMILIDLEKASTKIHGLLSRRLLEVRPGVFVGAVSTRQADQLWLLVTESAPGAGLLVLAANTELGLRFKTCGEHRYQIENHDGLELVSLKKKQNVFETKG